MARKIKTPNKLRVLRGPERIRTAVRAFAELCLAARPQDQNLNLLMKHQKIGL